MKKLSIALLGLFISSSYGQVVTPSSFVPKVSLKAYKADSVKHGSTYWMLDSVLANDTVTTATRALRADTSKRADSLKHGSSYYFADFPVSLMAESLATKLPLHAIADSATKAKNSDSLDHVVGTSYLRSDAIDTFTTLAGDTINIKTIRGSKTSTRTGTTIENAISTTFAPTAYSANSLTNIALYSSYSSACSTSNIRGADIYSSVTGAGWIGQQWGAMIHADYGGSYNAVSPGNSIYALGLQVNLTGDGGNPAHGMLAKFQTPSRTGTTRFQNWCAAYIDDQGGYGSDDNQGILFAYPGAANCVAWSDSGWNVKSKMYALADARNLIIDPDSLTKLQGAAVVDTVYFHRMFGRDGGASASIGTTEDNGLLQIWSVNGYYSYLRPRSNPKEGSVGTTDYPYGAGYIGNTYVDTIQPLTANTGQVGTSGNAFNAGYMDTLVTPIISLSATYSASDRIVAGNILTAGNSWDIKSYGGTNSIIALYPANKLRVKAYANNNLVSMCGDSTAVWATKIDSASGVRTSKVTSDTVKATKGIAVGSGTMLNKIVTGNATGWTLENTVDTNLVAGVTATSRLSVQMVAATAVLTKPLCARAVAETLFISCAAADTAAVRAGSVDYLIFK